MSEPWRSVLAASEWRRAWSTLVLIGLIAGLGAGIVVGSAAIARRTATAQDRLTDVTNASDIEALVFGGNAVASTAIGEKILSLPTIDAGRIGLAGFARVDGPEVAYYGVVVGPDDWGNAVNAPVLVAGRLPDPTRADEVVFVDGSVGDEPEPPIGTSTMVHFLTLEEFASFEAGQPQEGRGGDQQLTVVGVVRGVAPTDAPPFIASPALADAGHEGVGVLAAVFAQVGPNADVDDVASSLTLLGASVERPSMLDGVVPPVGQTTTREAGVARVATTTRTLVAALWVLAGIAALVTLAAIGEVAMRFANSTVESQRTENALGLTQRQRTSARTLAAVPACAIATVLTLSIGVATAGLLPPGTLRAIEPSPGWAPNTLLICMGALIAPILTLATVAWAVGRSLSRSTRSRRNHRPTPARFTNFADRPSVMIGLQSAFGRSGDRTDASTANLATLVLCATGVVVGFTFVSNLDDLLATPVRWGFPADFQIADADHALAETFAGDDRFDGVVYAFSADASVEGRSTVGTSLEGVQGEVEWDLAAGRPPATATEVVLPVRLADELGKGVGDLVAFRDIRGDVHELGVVGVGIVANYDTGVPVGRLVGLTADGVRLTAAGDPYGAVAVTVRPGLNQDAIADELGSTYEITRGGYPTEVSNLAEIRSLLVVTTAMLTVVAYAAIGYGSLTTGRRGRHSLAVLSALGFTPRNRRNSLTVMAAAMAAASLAIAVPLGIFVAASLWRRLIDGAGLVFHLTVPTTALLVVALVLVAIGVGTAAAQAARIRRTQLIDVLRVD